MRKLIHQITLPGLLGLGAIVGIFLMFVLSSCSTIHKVFHKEKKDSVSVHHVDSVVKVVKDTAFKKDTEIVVKERKDTSFKHQTIIIEQEKEKVKFDTSGRVKEKTTTKTKTTINTDSAGHKVASTINLVAIDSAGKIEASTYETYKSDSTHLKASTSSKEVKKVRNPTLFILALCLLILIAFVVYRNRAKIKAILIHVFTGL
jgi:predicted component of type VI protein secretion system